MINLSIALELSKIDFDTNFLQDYAIYKEFNDFEELLSYLNDDDGNYISDSISEYADSLIDIFYYDLRQWVVDNWGYVEQAAEEFGAVEDYHEAIQQGQYLYHSEQINEDVQNFIEYIKGGCNV